MPGEPCDNCGGSGVAAGLTGPAPSGRAMGADLLVSLAQRHYDPNPGAVEHTRELGRKRLVLGVYGKNHEALRFYEKAGFTQIGERYRLELVGEVFNVLNHQNATAIDTTGYIMDGASSPGANARLTFLSGANGTARFGSITNANSTTLYRERQIQVAMRLRF